MEAQRIFIKAEGERLYRQVDGRWEYLRTDKWHRLGGKTRLLTIDGRQWLVRNHGGRRWMIEVEERYGELQTITRCHRYVLNPFVSGWN